jgi:hypothetical protein
MWILHAQNQCNILVFVWTPYIQYVPTYTHTHKQTYSMKLDPVNKYKVVAFGQDSGAHLLPHTQDSTAGGLSPAWAT